MAILIGLLAACEAPTKPPAAVGSVVVGPGSSTVDGGSTVQYGVIVSDANGRVLQGREVTWTVDDTSVATISPSGLLTAKTHPDAVNRSSFVRAEAGGRSGVATIAVRPATVGQIDIQPFAATLQDGDAPTLVVEVRDALGNVLPGRPPTWTSRDITTAEISSAGVLTPVGFIAPGNRTVWIVANIEAVFDSIQVTVAPTTITSIVTYPAQPYVQSGWAKTLRVEGRSPGGNAVLGLSPTFTSSNPAIATVNSAGTVSALPAVTGTTDIIAEYGAFADTVTVTVDACGAAPAGTFPLDIRFFGPNPPSATVVEAFTCAANRIRAIIRSPVAGVNFPNVNISGCIGESVIVNEVITGLVIYAKVDSIDGAGKVLGSAGPCYINSSSRRPALGIMSFDSADLNALASTGRLGAVIMHEMLHVVGIGTMWRDNLLNPLMWTGAVTDPGFLGARAFAACRNDHGGANTCLTHVPIEDCVGYSPDQCGAGTLHGHWREQIFRRELMTGYVSSAGIQNPFSRMTIEALGDLGYDVDPEQSNDYVIPPPALMGLFESGSRSGELQMPPPRMPTHTVDPMGRLRPILR